MKVRLSPPVLRKTVVGAALVVAFLFMASIFVPDRIQAGGEQANPYSSEVIDSMAPLGQLESEHYTVKFFATPSGPLYSVYDRERGALLAELLRASQVAERFPELALPDAHADVSLELMGTDVGPRSW